MRLSAKRFLAPALAGFVLTAASSAASAFTVVGTLSPPPPMSGTDSVVFELLAGSSFTAIMSGTSTVVGLLYGDAPAPLMPTFSYTMGPQTIYGFSGLALGTYTFDLFGAAGTPYMLTVVPPYGGEVALVPEPQTLALALGGLCAVGALSRRRLGSHAPV